MWRRVIWVTGGLAALTAAAVASAAEKHALHTFKKTQLSDQFFSEGANFADFNRDGAGDIVSGPFVYWGPKFTERTEYYPAKPFDIEAYSDNFFAFTHDIDGDEWTDIIIVGFPGAETFWYRNPQGKAEPWERYTALAVTDNESPTLEDLTGDGRPDLVCMSGGRLGYAEIPDDPKQPWKFVPVSPAKGEYQRFTHGLGLGDVNADGKTDLLVKEGWYEQPPSLGEEKEWAFHGVEFSGPGGSHMFAYDLDGDGDNDVITAKAAHAYGLAWFENVGKKADGNLEFREHKIMGERTEENEYGVAFSQLHSMALVDMDHDGLKDIVTGKRWWAHSSHDPGSLEPAVIYWFKMVRENGGVRFVPYQADDNSGVGTQVVVGDVNGDKWEDVVVGSKKGTFLLTHRVEEVDEASWEKSQPVRREDAKPQAESKDDEGTKAAAEDSEGILPTAADGRVLNLGFEKGDLSDWTVIDGAAFEMLPVKGDAVRQRRNDSASGHQGDYWLGTYERTGDGPQGTLESAPFTVTHPWASFLVGGGSGKALGAEVVRKDTGDVIFHGSGRAREQMERVVVDLREVEGKEILLRVLDKGSAGWGHTNFDDFRFHEKKPEFAALASAAATADGVKLDDYPYAGLPGEEAVSVMKLPPGFKAILAAAEPDVKQPIAMALDDRGRLWVAEAYEYPVRAEVGKGRDRILIFEDADGDGKFDKRSVFAEGLNLVSGIEVGFGGVWVGAAPYFMFIPDRDGDDKPDGEPEILLDGWAWQDTHETLNTFIWGPDGWLYGCHGVFTHSRVGKPGTPDDKRIPLNAAIWRYHPTRHEFEVFAEGTSNPWGVDFDDYGNAFCTACVIPHLYHIIPGARYQRQGGSHFNPYTYADIQTIADHRHYVGDTPHGGNGSSGDAGGGHAHAGAMIYLGGTWPEEYRGRIFMNNIHGQRLNTDVLKPQGSGFVGSHGPDFLLTGDLASQMLNIRYGPDGNAWVIDWYDTNACHHNNVEGHDRSNGRIYKIVYGDAKAEPVDLKKLSDIELAELTLHKNDWYVRHARRILQERAAEGGKEKVEAARTRLAEILEAGGDVTRSLRALWALQVTGGWPLQFTDELLRSPDEYVRAWTVRLMTERLAARGKPFPDTLAQFEAQAEIEKSPVVRLALASALQKVPAKERTIMLDALVKHSEDAGDHNLPLMYWYAAEPLAEHDPGWAVRWALKAGETIPLLRDLMMRRVAALGREDVLEAAVSALGEVSDPAAQIAMLKAMRQGLEGRRRVKAPSSWAGSFKSLTSGDNDELRTQAVALGVTFGDLAAMDWLRTRLESKEAEADLRREALQSLLAAKDPQLAPTLLRLLAEPAIREAALAGLSAYDDGAVPDAVLGVYSQLSPTEKRVAIATLCARPASGLALLKAIEAKKLPASDLPADMVRQLHLLKNGDIDRMLAEYWGTVRSTPEDKSKLIDSLRDLLYDPPARPDMELGRAVFAKTCQQCHTLYGTGGNVGPDLTGSNRADQEYLLSNVVDPSAVMAKDYQQTVLLTADGLVVAGIVKREDDKSVTIQTATETVVVPKDEIEDRQLSDASMMPDDQLKQFSPIEIVSLAAYLAGKEQVPLLARADNAALLFNGKDLTGWRGNSQLWSVENGEIVGRSEGLDHNEFLLSDMSAEDFKLSMEVKLAPNKENSGIQFRSVPIEGGEVRGYQADMGAGWWGKLYEEQGRALLWDKSGEEHVKQDQWNRYEIQVQGSRVQTWINGQLCVDMDDPAGKRRGIFALQIHAGGPMEVRFRDMKLEVLQ